MDVKQKFKKKTWKCNSTQGEYIAITLLFFLLYKIKDSLLDMLHTYSKFLVIASKSSNY